MPVAFTQMCIRSRFREGMWGRICKHKMGMRGHGNNGEYWYSTSSLSHAHMCAHRFRPGGLLDVIMILRSCGIICERVEVHCLFGLAKEGTQL